jgi:hypothetical protein
VRTPVTWDLDQAPALVLEQVDHTGAGTSSLHNILDKYLLETRAGTYSQSDILAGLEKAYTDFKQPDAWIVAKTWLQSVGAI